MNDEQHKNLSQKLDRLATRMYNLNGITRANYQLNLETTYQAFLTAPRQQQKGRLLKHGYKSYSQNEEDGIIAEIFNRIGTEHKSFVEFGVEDGLECNTLNLTLSGWRGLWMDGSPQYLKSINERFGFMIESGQLTAMQAMIDAENINGLIKDNFGPDVDLLSVDIDRNDYWVWKAIDVIHPRVVIVEYNATIRPPIAVTIKYDAAARWNGSNYFGASLSALEKLGEEKGYSLVGCNYTGSNSFFVRNDLVGDRFYAPFTAENHHEPPRYHVWLPSGHQKDFGPYEQV